MTKPRVIVLRGILRDGQGRFLLLKRSRSSKTWPGCWEFPGGKVDTGEELATALRREFWEETGLEVEAVGLYDAFEWERAEDYIISLVYNVRGTIANVMISAEHEAFCWCSLAELKDLVTSLPFRNIVLKLFKE